MKKTIMMLSILGLAIAGCSNSETAEQKLERETYAKFEDKFYTEEIYRVPRIPVGIDRPDLKGMYNLKVGDDNFIVQKLHIIDYKNKLARTKIKNEDYAIIQINYPSEIITNFDTRNIINEGYIVFLDKDNIIKRIEKADGQIIKANTKTKKILIAPNYFVEYRLNTGDAIPALR